MESTLPAHDGVFSVHAMATDESSLYNYANGKSVPGELMRVKSN